MEELGELAAAHRRGKRTKVVNGIIDLMVFLLGLLEILGIDGDEEMKNVLDDNETRRYIVNKDGSQRRIR